MKILWFANTPGLAETETGQSGGWIKSLQKELILQKNIELGFVFFTKRNEQPFFHSSTHYYPIYKPPLSFFNKIRLILGFSLNHKALTAMLLYPINQFKPDVIHIHGTENPFGLIAKHVNIPIVISIQGILNEIIKYYYKGFSLKDLVCYLSTRDLLSSKGFILAGQAMKSNAKIEKHIFKLNNNYIGRTNWDKNKINKYSPNSFYYKVNEPLRDSFYVVSKNHQNSTTNQILSVINPAIYKGLDIIFQAANFLVDNYRINFKWVIAGISSSDPVVQLAEKKFKLVSKNINIEFAGKLNEFELKKVMLNSKLIVHPSYIENSSNSIGETQLLNKTLIVANCGGNPDMLKNYSKGILYESSDYKELSLLIAKNFDNEHDEKDINVSDIAFCRHNKKIILNNLLNVYNEIIHIT